MFGIKNYNEEIEILRKKIENLEIDFKEVKLKYNSWLEEKEITISIFRDKIKKKLEYMDRTEEKKTIEQQAKEKIMRRYGYGTKREDLNTSDI